MDQSKRIVDSMMALDKFSQWLGLERLEEEEGYSRLGMTVRPEMCNGFQVAHGGICYSLADSALAFASNSLGHHAMSIETSISHIQPVKAGDVLIATTREISRGKRLAHYEVKIERDDLIVASFKGVVYIKDTAW